MSWDQDLATHQATQAQQSFHGSTSQLWLYSRITCGGWGGSKIPMPWSYPRPVNQYLSQMRPKCLYFMKFPRWFNVQPLLYSPSWWSFPASMPVTVQALAAWGCTSGLGVFISCAMDQPFSWWDWLVNIFKVMEWEQIRKPYQDVTSFRSGAVLPVLISLQFDISAEKAIPGTEETQHSFVVSYPGRNHLIF